MDDLHKISEIVEENVNFIQKSFEEAIAELKYKEEELKIDKKSVAGSFKEVDSVRESVEARLLQVVEKEKEFRLLQENGLRLFELKKKEVDLILEDVKVREEKLDKQEKMVQGFFQRIELEIKKFESIQKSLEERFDAISPKERQVENRLRELKLIENEIERKAIEIHNKEENLKTHTRNFHLREKALALKKEELVAKENELEAKEMVLASRKEEFVAKENELERRVKILHLKTGEENESANLVNGGKGECGLPKVDAAHPRECRELRGKGKKRVKTDTDNAVSVPPESSIRTNIAKTTALNNFGTEYADPEFHDFDKDREKSRFAVDQFWACYDTVDAMPRFYMQIKKVNSRKFKLHVTWLEAVQEYQRQVDSLVKDLPVACGKFIYGNSEDITDIRSCSHQIHCEEDRVKGSYMIYPGKGETWALFKDLDIRKKSNSGRIEPYEYEIVVVLSDFVEITGIRVAYLDKLEGYVSLFQRKKESTSFLIRPSQLFRFSHRIPSYQMNGTERKGVPEGCFELDPASLPAKM